MRVTDQQFFIWPMTFNENPNTLSLYEVYSTTIHQREPTHSIAISIKIYQTELMAEIYSKSLVRANGKELLVNIARTTIKTHKGDEKWPLFVHKHTAVLVVRINNIGQ